MSLWINAVGFPTGVWAAWSFASGEDLLPVWVVALACLNLAAFALSFGALYVNTWKRTGLVLEKFWPRVGYMLRINPVFVAVWWVLWLIPLAIGFYMYLRDRGQVWERTEKINANQSLFAYRQASAAHDSGSDGHPASGGIAVRAGP